MKSRFGDHCVSSATESPNRPKGERDYTRPFYTLDIITI